MQRVLIVDDHADNRYLLRALLEGHGYTVDEAAHGEEALRVARQTPPVLVISDLLMPVMDGYTLLREWKADATLRSVPFIVYTATYTDTQDERLAMDLGADAFIVKPSEPEPFMVRVTEVLATQGRDGNTAEQPRIEAGAAQHQHSAVLVRKLEQKARQLEESNRELLAEVAERRRAEAALIESEERHRNLFNAITDALFVYDRETLACVAVNDAAVSRYGYSRDELLGMTVDSLRLTPQPSAGGVGSGLPGARAADSTVADADVTDAGAAGNGAQAPVQPGLHRHRSRDGQCIDVEVTASEVTFSGRPACMLQVRDVTRQRELEEQFRHAQRMEAVGRLAGGVAHDFNNLLTVINSYADLAVEQLAPEHPARELVAEIIKAGDRAAALTRGLLGMSRRQVLEATVLDPNAVVSNVEGMLRRLIGEDIVLLTTLDARRIDIRADATQVEQVLLNLAVNARDAMPRGGRLTIETRRVELDQAFCATTDGLQPGPHLRLRVSDTGCGMDATTRARLFEAFFTTKGVDRGTGLGLTTVDGIVKQLHGAIHVDSEPGQGTTFTVYLPGCAVAPEASAANSRVAVARPMPGGTETILLVEDEGAVRDLTRRVLERCGYSVLEAADGEEALRIVAAETGPIDLLISDVVMPHLGGRALAERFTALRPRAQVLFMSGYTDDAVLRHGVQGGEFAFLQKPFTPSSMARKVRSVLDGPHPDL